MGLKGQCEAWDSHQLPTTGAPCSGQSMGDRKQQQEDTPSCRSQGNMTAQPAPPLLQSLACITASLHWCVQTNLTSLDKPPHNCDHHASQKTPPPAISCWPCSFRFCGLYYRFKYKVFTESPSHAKESQGKEPGRRSAYCSSRGCQFRPQAPAPMPGSSRLLITPVA